MSAPKHRRGGALPLKNTLPMIKTQQLVAPTVRKLNGRA